MKNNNNKNNNNKNNNNKNNKIKKIRKKINKLKNNNNNKIKIKRKINNLRNKIKKIKRKEFPFLPRPLMPPIYLSYPNPPHIVDKLLVLFVFHKYNDRVDNFIKNCIFYDKNIDFIIISNNKKISFETPSYVKKIYRENIGYDFGGWSDALLTNDLYKDYENFIFVNSSVIGPYIASDYKGKWTDIYINGLQDNVKLFGSTINTCKNHNLSHVQSYIFSMNINTLKYLINCEIFSITKYAKTFRNAIRDKEILMSRKIIENNWNIGSLLLYYNNVDFTFKNKKLSDCDIMFLDDVMYQKCLNKIWTKKELVFVKGNRIKYSI